MAFDWRGIVGTVAPGIATALGGPLAGMGMAAICRALGIENDPNNQDETEKRVSQALQVATPETLLALKKEDHAFIAAMRQMDIDLEKIHAGDRDSARKRQMEVKDRFPAVLACLLTLMFAGVLAAHIWVTIPPENATQMNVMLGSLGTAWLASIYYYFGTSSGSKSKENTMSQALLTGGKA